ncbi:S41 family peptidase [Patescibacteria group bacterium]
MKNKIIFGAIILILIAVIFTAGFFIGQKLKVCQICQPSDIDFSLFWEAWNKLQEKFVDKNFDTEKMIYGAISGMVDSLEDPYTVFFPPKETQRFLEDVEGKFEGVGMEVGIREGSLQVIAPLEGTPAQKAGLRPSDKILEINGTSTINLTIDEAVGMIRGQKGTQVILTIFREEWGESREVSLIRAVIEIPSLKLEFKEDNSIAHLKLYQFSEKASSDFSKASLEILNSSAEKIILDLRSNPGGYLEVAQYIAGWFLEKEEIVVIEDFGNGNGQQNYLSKGPSEFSDYKIIVLINQGSASAAEILAGALRDNRNVLLVGEKSFGKGSVQELASLREGASIKITIAKWLTPKGSLISDVGLEPDIKIEMTDQDYLDGKDPQLDKAIEVILGL